jgi:beta-alanine degradation protein BauB
MKREITGVMLGICAALGLGLPAAHAQEAAPSFQASPDVYKVIAENDKFRVIVATWKPGQRDKPHSHKAGTIYNLTNCTTRNHAADGKTTDNPVTSAGSARMLNPVASHSNENIGSADCQILFTEMK